MRVWIPLLLLLSPPLRAAPCSWLDSIRLASRTGSQACWVQVGSKEQTICISRDDWRTWLASETPLAWCGLATGRWRTFSPPENDFEPKIFLSRLYFRSFLTGRRTLSYVRWIERTRESLSEWLSPADSSGIFRSLLLGERASRRPADFLRLLGFVHLLSATGIHLYALSAFWLEVGRRVSSGMRIQPRIALPWIRLCVGLSWVWSWLLCGARIGMLRPLLLICLRRSARRLGFRWRSGSPLALALLIDGIWGILRGEPFFRSDRIFYALAVGGGMLAFEEKPKHWLRAHLLSSLGSWIFSAIWECLHIAWVSLATPLLSLITIPVFCAFLYPVLLLSSIFVAGGGQPGSSLLSVFAFSQSLVLQAASVVLKSESIWVVAPLWIWLAMPFSVLLVTWSGPRKNALRVALVAVLMIFRLFGSHTTSQKSDFARDVIQLDVGQGDAALVLTHDDHAGLIDAGSERALSDRAWLETLARFGVRKLDWVALTHLDEDHRGGLEHLMRLVPIGCVASAKEQWESPRGKSLARRLLREGTLPKDWSSGCVPFPVRGPGHSSNRKANDAMGAVLIPLRSGGFYLSAGDADQDDEILIARWANREIHSMPSRKEFPRVLKISHHGSKTSTAPETLWDFRPDVALISSGVGNTYGHPSQEVLLRLKQARIPIRRTDREGAIRAADVLRQRPEHRP